MFMRARDRALHALRLLRLALAPHVHERQLRFALGAQYSFGDPAWGFARPPGDAYGLTLSSGLVDRLRTVPIAGLGADPADDVRTKADVAVRWLDRAVVADEPLVALLFAFFALEAFLGDKAEGAKAHKLAFRQMTLGHAVTGGFSHPDRVWLLYDKVRSGAVHGEKPTAVDSDTARRLVSSVSETLDQYLLLAEREGIRRRGRLMTFLDAHPDRDSLRVWLHQAADPQWDRFLGRAPGTAVAAPSGTPVFDGGTPSS
jgi:hypothetical protein